MIKRILRIGVLWTGPIAVAAVGGWLWLHGGRFVSTDNAYLKTEMVTVSTELSGRIVEIFGKDNTRVEAGQLLLRLDDEIHRIRLAEAEANIAKVRSDIASLRADYKNKQADVAKAEADSAHFDAEFARLRRLKDSGSVSAIDADAAEFAAVQARKELAIRQQALEVVEAKLIDPKLPPEAHPDYKLALAQRDKAALDLTHVELRAPVSGVLANYDVKVGEVVNASVPLFSIVDDSHVWVEANFKETDLTWLREGQDATIAVDTFPELEWHGEVSAITPGTGSEFALLPAQNSSGNWVKVVQRVAVTLDMDPLPNAPQLRAGLSAHVTVDTQHERKAPWQR
ncbi:MAG: HlyD family secretion protein [Pseudomonadota bacterium]|nr:HlyD family secretion protein [Pseudomonadota bacterium]